MHRFTLPAATLAVTIAASVAAQTTPAPTPSATPRPSATPAPSASPAAATVGRTPTSTATGATQATSPAMGAPTQGTSAAATAPNPAVGGAPMDPTKPIATNAAAAPNLSTLVAAIKAAGLEATLSGPGPYTLFAPTNEAFSRLAPGTVEKLMEPANKPSLIKILNYHVVPGALTLEDLRARITAGGGTTTLTTVEGDPLTIAAEGNAVSIADATGNKAYIQKPDVRQSNGIIHVVNGVVVPKLS